jgi:hypothetical protein
MSHVAYTPQLPGLTANDDLDTVIDWGLGADSTAYLERVLTDVRPRAAATVLWTCIAAQSSRQHACHAPRDPHWRRTSMLARFQPLSRRPL